jgi:hypothetical protein
MVEMAAQQVPCFLLQMEAAVALVLLEVTAHKQVMALVALEVTEQRPLFQVHP